jgi:hypothetical protein
MNMLRHYRKALDLFPFSPRNPGESILRVQAVSASEPPLLERAFPDPLDPAQVISAANEFLADDCAYTLDAWWGLWTFAKEWSLRPARVSIRCFGPAFLDTPRNDAGESPEHLRIEFGVDTWFLPQNDLPDPTWYARSNLKGLLKYVHSLDDALPLDRRALWSESGENFAEKLREAAQEL